MTEKIVLNAIDMNCVTHIVAGTRRPAAETRRAAGYRRVTEESHA